MENPLRSISAFADSTIAPHILVSLCRSYNCDIDAVLQLYAIELCIQHSRKRCKNRRAKLQMAQKSLNAIDSPNNERIRQMLSAIEQRFCPYDYEAIQMGLDWCQQYVTDTELLDWVGQMQKFLGFLR